MIASIITGFIVGLIARFLIPGRQQMGIVFTTILGIAGAWVAGFIGRGLGWYRPDQAAGIFASIVGAVIILAIYAWAVQRRAASVTP